MAYRYDIAELASPKKLPNGCLQVEAYLTRVGVFEYLNTDGAMRRELRHPDEVFAPESLKSFEMNPVTDSHPREPVRATNWTQLARGQVTTTPEAVGDKVRGSLLITDHKLIEKLEKRQAVQVSCGYTCDWDETPGVWEGQAYDRKQLNIRGDHVAVVKRGRAGPDVRIRLDAADAVMAHLEDDQDSQAVLPFTPKQGAAAMKITIDGIDFDPSTEQFAQAFKKQQEKFSQLVKDGADAVSLLDKEKARADAAEAALVKAQKLVADAADPKVVSSLVKARVALETQARKVLGKDAVLDEMDAAAIKIAVLQKLEPTFVADGLSDDYLNGRFEAELKHAGKSALGAVRAAAVNAQNAPVQDAASARDAMITRLRDAHLKPTA